MAATCEGGFVCHAGATRSCDVVQHAGLRQPRSGQADGAAAEAGGQHAEGEGASAVTPIHTTITAHSVFLEEIGVLTDFFAGVQGFIRPDALLWGARQERPAANGRPRLREPLQGQAALHGFVEQHLNSCF